MKLVRLQLKDLLHYIPINPKNLLNTLQSGYLIIQVIVNKCKNYQKNKRFEKPVSTSTNNPLKSNNSNSHSKLKHKLPFNKKQINLKNPLVNININFSCFRNYCHSSLKTILILREHTLDNLIIQKNKSLSKIIVKLLIQMKLYKNLLTILGVQYRINN